MHTPPFIIPLFEPQVLSITEKKDTPVAEALVVVGAGKEKRVDAGDIGHVANFFNVLNPMN